jgi:hypothetical protein
VAIVLIFMIEVVIIPTLWFSVWLGQKHRPCLGRGEAV